MLVFEPQHFRAGNAARRKPFTHAGFDSAEVFPDDERPGAGHLEADESEHFVGREMHVCAGCRWFAGGNPELAEQAHDVIDAQAVDPTQGGPQGRDERFVQRIAEPPRNERWDAPLLPVLAEWVRRCTDTQVEREEFLELPCVCTVRRETEREITDEADARRADPLQLLADDELTPLMKDRPAGECRIVAELVRDRLPIATAEHLRPTLPDRTVLVAQRIPDSHEVRQRGKGRRLGEDLLERDPFGHPGFVAIDQLSRVADEVRRGWFLEADQQWVPCAAAARVVGAVFLRQRWRRLVEGAHENGSSACLNEFGGNGREIGEIADSPRPLAPQRIDLGRDAPRLGDGRARRGMDDQPRGGSAAPRRQVVIADRQIARQFADVTSIGAILEHEPAWVPQRMFGADGYEPQRWAGDRAAHARAQSLAGVVRCRMPRPGNVEESVGDAPLVVHVGQSGAHVDPAVAS